VAAQLQPTSPEEAARALAGAAREGLTVRITGGGTKPWGTPPAAPPDQELSTLGLRRVVEHEAGDFTLVVEAGLPLAELQRHVAEAGQRLVLDPPLGPGDAATIGGVIAAGDSGPLRHRYGGPRDLVLGVRVALSDGTLARSGGKVIKNVAGYDLSKLNTGAFGTLGVLCEVAVRLHPVPAATATVRVPAADAAALQQVALALSHARIETEALDVRWEDGSGEVLGRYAGAAAPELARAAREVAGPGAEVVEDDDALWDAQRRAQRAAEGGAVVRVSGRPDRLAVVAAAADAHGARLVGRAALGLSWLALPAASADDLGRSVADVRARLSPLACTVLDGPAELRRALDPWGGPGTAELAVMRRVKARFDPAGALNPGTFVGGI
jgi:glycolate oxidase FAD binding subunit